MSEKSERESLGARVARERYGREWRKVGLGRDLAALVDRLAGEEIARLTTDLAAAREERDKARSLLASATDVANVYARELSVQEAQNEECLVATIERIAWRANRVISERDAARAEAERERQRLNEWCATLTDGEAAMVERVRVAEAEAERLDVENVTLRNKLCAEDKKYRHELRYHVRLRDLTRKYRARLRAAMNFRLETVLMERACDAEAEAERLRARLAAAEGMAEALDEVVEWMSAVRSLYVEERATRDRARAALAAWRAAGGTDV